MIAMSGGVDSSAAAYLVKKSYGCASGVTLKLTDRETSDISDAKKTADKAGIDHYVLDLRQEFKKYVIDEFVNAYQNGLTPNPCIFCNKHIKFGLLHESAVNLGFDLIATGHYSIIEKQNNRFLLKKATDITKDQSYVLYSLSQDQLSRTLFPLGNLTKAEVREIALSSGFVNASKKDSQDICFVPDGDYAKFIEEYTKKSFDHGNFVDKDGNILGEHKGIINYTIGQRKGLGLSFDSPRYVCSKCAKTNTVVLGKEPDLLSTSLDCTDLNLIACDKLDSTIRVKAKTRYKQQEQWALISQTSETTAHIEFEEPQRAVTAGQSVVFYDGDYVVGGGIIK
ncbi:MAG: tRNA 2-thiouridine(34) synthase MnmA [Clostridia bacterium]|nr:tRNA 2-thiouridine(34) synthase MnmA [Clostridia bacterium]